MNIFKSLVKWWKNRNATIKQRRYAEGKRFTEEFIDKAPCKQSAILELQAHIDGSMIYGGYNEWDEGSEEAIREYLKVKNEAKANQAELQDTGTDGLRTSLD